MWVVQSLWVKVASRFANWRSFLTIRDGANRPDFGGTGIGLLITIFQGNSVAFQFSFVLVVQIKRPNQLFLSRLPPLYPTLELPLTVPFPFSSCYVLLPCFALLVYRTRMIPRFPANNHGYRWPATLLLWSFVRAESHELCEVCFCLFCEFYIHSFFIWSIFEGEGAFSLVRSANSA